MSIKPLNLGGIEREQANKYQWSRAQTPRRYITLVVFSVNKYTYILGEGKREGKEEEEARTRTTKCAWQYRMREGKKK